MRTETSKKYWFPAKRYGWGWGIPNTWQGWVVFIAYFITIALVGFFFLPNRNPFLFVIAAGIATIVLTAVCWKKGEPPRWRWGGSDLE